MEKGIISYIRKQFELKEVDIHTYSPLTLAYIGDGIFDLIVRTVVVGRGNANVGNLHKKTSHVVKAQTQAKMIGQLLPYLTEEEADIYRRGRNAHSPTMAKNATMSDYRKATGLEALIGYLYLEDQLERILFLIQKGMEQLHERI
ncbi:MAG: ribonuclease III [Eubacterium sp.]|jgi:ribonuclease-3 family protein|nr:ribonuclease III [Eubacterium sp.]